jgi:hypothetical protein
MTIEEATTIDDGRDGRPPSITLAFASPGSLVARR